MRKTIFEDNLKHRDGREKTTRVEGARVEFRIPEQDYPVLCMLFPGLSSKDADERHAAWKEFTWSPIAEPYFVVRTPRQVQRDQKRGVIIR